MSEYTPTTEQVRHAADWDRSWIVKGPEFDRWLKRVRAEEREQCAQIAASFRLNADVETVVGLSWNRDMDKLIAAIRERQAPEVERVRADERAKAQAEFIDWLIETVHYPFDVTYDVPPPIDIDALADRWNEVDGWHVSAEEARACVREEAAIRAVSEQDPERSAE